MLTLLHLHHTHCPTLLQLYLRHSSFYSHSIASPMLPGEPPMSLWWCLTYPWWFCNVQWLRPAEVYERCKLALELKRLKTAVLHELSPDHEYQISKLSLLTAGHVARMEQSRHAYRVLVGIPDGKRPKGRPSRRWDDNIKMDLREVGCVLGEWMALTEDRVQRRCYVRTLMNLRVP